MAATRMKQNGDHEIQQAARDAARREGKTLGEWLHDTIADRAAELGVAESQVVGQERADAVYARIERSRANGVRSQRRVAGGRAPSRPQFDDYEPTRGRMTRSRADLDDDYDDDADRRYARDGRNVRRTHDTLTSFADLLERNEIRRSQERDAVSALTEKLARLESKLTARYEAGDHPVKGALARLEARLDAIGRRDAAETVVRANAERPTVASGSVSRLEEKLDSILQAVHDGPLRFASETAPAALLDRQQSEPDPARKRLGDAIADISRRQRALDGGTAARSGQSHGAQARAADEAKLPEAFPAPGGGETPAAEIDMATLAAKVDALRFDMMVGRSGWGENRDSALASVRDELETLAQRQSESERRVQELRSSNAERASRQLPSTGDSVEGVAASAPEPSTAANPAPDRPAAGLGAAELMAIAAEAPIVAPLAPSAEAPALITRDQAAASSESKASEMEAELTALRALEERLELLSGKVDRALSDRSASGAEPAADASIAAVECLLRELGEKIEQVGTPRADEASLDELQQKVEHLSSRFARSEQDLATLPTLAGTVNELFQQFEATRTSIEDKASRAAREALDRLLEERAAVAPGAGDEASLRAMQAEADLRTRSTLTTVHEMLEKVVGRLAQMETAIAELRAGRDGVVHRPDVVGAPEARARPAVSRSLDDLSALELSFGAVDAGRPTSRSVLRAAEMDAPARTADVLGETAQQADFIAAARRAAQSAQAGSVPQTAEAAEEEIRAGLLAKSRAFVASNRRPVLVGVAAILMVLGAITVLQRLSLGGNETVAKAERKAGLKVASADIAAPVKPQVRIVDKATGAPAGKAVPATNAQAGTDTMETGSISKLPSFAAQAALGPTVQQQQQRLQPLPAGLKAAAEAGNSAAQYTLAVRYSEGLAVPRDLKLAAHWFEKAAASGLAPARYRLASMYEKGLGVAEDKAKAKALYLQAAEAGNPRAMHNLGVLLADGGGRPDYSAAAEWFGKAADRGVHDSQFNLAVLLARGLGMQQSLIQSYRWFAVAAAHNDADAARKRDEVAAKLNATELATAKALAADFHAAPVDSAAVDVSVPPGGWDSLPLPSHLNSPKSKVSSL